VTGRDQTSLAWAEELHRRVAALATAASRAGVEHPELSRVNERLTRQQTLFAQAWVATGMPSPRLTPTPEEVAAAGAALGDLSADAVDAAARTMASTLDEVDAALAPAAQPPAAPAQPPAAPARPTAAPPAVPAGPATAGPAPAGPGGWPVRRRNGLIYGCFALGVFIVHLATALDEAHPYLLVLSMLVLPIVAWIAAIVTIAILFRGSPGGVSTTPKMGLLICLAPDLLLCCGLIGLAGTRLLS
jgi:hypothetical protein